MNMAEAACSPMMRKLWDGCSPIDIDKAKEETDHERLLRQRPLWKSFMRRQA